MRHPPEVTALLAAARAGLHALADPVTAPQMRSYMRSEMPFLGVPKPARTILERRLVAEHPMPDAEVLELAVRS